jgi:transcriptional regulator with XRE-family HTH domain
MRKTFKEFKTRALARPEVRREYDRLADEFAFLDDILKARAEAGLTQAEVAARIGSTQSAVARLESAGGRHSPSIGTLQRYAAALGCKLLVRLIKESSRTAHSTRTRAKTGHKRHSGQIRTTGQLKRVLFRSNEPCP